MSFFSGNTGCFSALGSIILGVLSGFMIFIFGDGGATGFASLGAGIVSIPFFTIFFWIGFYILYILRDRTEDNSEYEKKKNTIGKSKNSDSVDTPIEF